MSLLGSVFARQISADAGAVETMMFRDGWLSEAAASNVWVVRNGRVLGPPKDNLVLEGIRYGLIEALCRETGIPFELRRISREEVLAADELMLSSATKEVLPVTRLDDSPSATASPAPSIEAVRRLPGRQAGQLSMPDLTQLPTPQPAPDRIADRIPLAFPDQGHGRQGGRLRRRPSP